MVPSLHRSQSQSAFGPFETTRASIEQLGNPYAVCSEKYPAFRLNYKYAGSANVDTLSGHAVRELDTKRV